MKRSELRRKSGMPRATYPIARSVAMPLTNAERRARREREKRKKYARFRRSPGRRAALERAAGRCEMVLLDGSRCPATTHLTVHHKTYSRFGGAELPTDLVVLCKAHHERHHATTGAPKRPGRKSA